MSSRTNMFHYETPPGSAASSVSVSEEMELSKQRRRHEAIMKARKRNMVAKSLLQDKMIRISRNEKLHFKQLSKEKRMIEEELSKTKKRNNSASISRLPSIAPSTSLTLTASEISLDKEPCANCLFGVTKSIRCKNFPCCLPKTYHTIGGQNLPISYSKLSNYRELQRRSRDVRPPTSHRIRRAASSDNNEIIRSPRKSVDDKIRGLHYLIHEMRESHEKNKPINWSTNYGEPVPKRLLLKPVVPTSTI